MKAKARQAIFKDNTTFSSDSGIALPAAPAANDSFYHELEMRYGGGFAQWLMDRLEPTKQ